MAGILDTIFSCLRAKKFPQATAGSWTIAFSTGMPPAMKREADGTFSMVIPASPGSVHYVYKKAPAVKQGQTITMIFRVEGNGEVWSVDGAPHPALVSLYMQEAGDNLSGKGDYTYSRWWGKQKTELKAGRLTMIAKVSPENWSSILGQDGADPKHQAGFAKCVANLENIGFTFGGTFAGHGVSVRNGGASFVLESFTIS